MGVPKHSAFIQKIEQTNLESCKEIRKYLKELEPRCIKRKYNYRACITSVEDISSVVNLLRKFHSSPLPYAEVVEPFFNQAQVSPLDVMGFMTLQTQYTCSAAKKGWDSVIEALRYFPDALPIVKNAMFDVIVSGGVGAWNVVGIREQSRVLTTASDSGVYSLSEEGRRELRSLNDAYYKDLKAISKERRELRDNFTLVKSKDAGIIANQTRDLYKKEHDLKVELQVKFNQWKSKYITR